jgi:hypothetical protein
MNTKFKTLILGVSALSAASVSLFARTTNFKFNQDVLTAVEFWDAWTQSPTLGTASNDLWQSPNQNDNQIQMYGNGNDVSVKITGDFVAGHPYTTTVENVFFGDIKLEIGATSVFTKNVNFIFENGAHVTYNATAATQTTGGNLTMNTTGNSSIFFSSGTHFANTTSTSIGTTTGYQKATIVGSSSTIQFRNFAFVGATTDKNNIVGGHLIFQAAANGISTLSIIGGGGSAWTGVIELDFTNFDWDAYGANEATFKLMTTNENLSTRIQNWIDSDLAIIKGADLVDWTVAANGLSVTLSRIPEPSTYAAIFGALALAFAAYRRRK